LYWIQTLFDLDLEKKRNRKREIENKPTTKVNPAPAQPFPRGPVRPALPSLAAQPARHLLSPRARHSSPHGPADRAAAHARSCRSPHSLTRGPRLPDPSSSRATAAPRPRDLRRPSYSGAPPQDPRRLLKRPSPHPRNLISTSAAAPKPSCRRTAPLRCAAALRRRGYAAPPHRSPGRGAHRLRLDLWSFPGPAALHSNLYSDLLRERRPRPPPGLRRRPPCAAAPSTATPR
jgi:hypothetical protein